MNNTMNSQMTDASRQFADTAAQVNRLALENMEKVFGLQIAALQENVNAAFSFMGQMAQVRDMDGLKAVMPKGAQVARESVERSIGAGQEVFGRTLKTNEAIATIAKGQVESATADATSRMQAATEQATAQATGKNQK